MDGRSGPGIGRSGGERRGGVHASGARGVVDGQRNTLGPADTYAPDTETVRNPAILGPAGCHAGASSADLAIGLTSRQQDAFNPKFAQGYFPDRVNYYLLLLIDELG